MLKENRMLAPADNKQASSRRYGPREERSKKLSLSFLPQGCLLPVLFQSCGSNVISTRCERKVPVNTGVVGVPSSR